MGIILSDGQIEAIKKMHNGCVLCGGVGSGKSRTSLAYYFLQQGGGIESDDYIPMSDPPQDLYIITTAKKRDSLEWEGEMIPFLISTNKKQSMYEHTVVVDSWNNIKRYKEVKNSFFIFDEQRVVGSGVWVESFLKIAKNNNWILLSATPGDKWEDYIPVFIANGFYKNKTEFTREHLIYSRFSKYPKVDRYINEGRLIRLRSKLLVDINIKRSTTRHHATVYTGFDRPDYNMIKKTRWNIFENKPIRNAAEYCYVLRRMVNIAEERQSKLLEILENHPRAIIFYNFDYELDILRDLCYGEGVEIAEWNGHKHQPVPESNKWVYLTQYTAGCEGWNCITTDTIIFYSLNYSYKVLEQAQGRIDRMNTPYKDLYYYHLQSRADIDLAISRAIDSKKKFNESKFVSRKNNSSFYGPDRFAK